MKRELKYRARFCIYSSPMVIRMFSIALPTRMTLKEMQRQETKCDAKIQEQGYFLCEDNTLLTVTGSCTFFSYHQYDA